MTELKKGGGVRDGERKRERRESKRNLERLRGRDTQLGWTLGERHITLTTTIPHPNTHPDEEMAQEKEEEGKEDEEAEP